MAEEPCCGGEDEYGGEREERLRNARGGVLRGQERGTDADEGAEHRGPEDTPHGFAVVDGMSELGLPVAVERHQQDEATAIAREQQLRQEAERKHRQSRQQIEENNQHIQQLEQQLDEARKQNDQLTIQKLKLDTEQLRAENANIEATNERKEYLLREFQESLIYQRILINAGKPKFHLRDEEWDFLAEWIDKVYDNFTTRLMALTPLNITERQICYLVKLNLKPSQIAVMLNITDTAISMNRNRLYKKIFHEKGSSKDFDEFIKNF